MGIMGISGCVTGKTFLFISQSHKNLLLIMRCFFNLGFKAIKDGRRRDVKVNHLGGKIEDDFGWDILWWGEKLHV